jgi:hypothetical protein
MGADQMTIDIQPTKIGDKHWIDVIIGGSKMGQHGPFSSVGVAEATAERMRRVARALTSLRVNGGSDHG